MKKPSGGIRRHTKFAAIAAVTIATTQSHAGTFSSVATGNYNADATWGVAANPANGIADDVTINGNTVSILNAADATNDTLLFANNAAVLQLLNDTATTFSLSTLDLTGSNQTITINRATNGGGLTDTLDASILTLGAARTLTVSKGAAITTTNAAYGLIINGVATVTGTQTVSISNNGSGIGTLTLTGAIGGTGSFSKTGSGMLYLQNAANAFSGGLVISGSTGNSVSLITADSDSALGSGSIRMSGGGIGANTSFTVSGSRTLGIGATTGSIAATGYLGALSGQVLTVDSLIASAGTTGLTSLQVGGNGALGKVVLTNNTNSFNGTVTVNGGTLEYSNPSQLGAGTAQNIVLGVNSGLASTLSYTGGAATVSRNIVTSGQDKTHTLAANGTGAITYSGNITNAQSGTGASGTPGRTIQLNGTSTDLNTLSGVISDQSTTSGGPGLTGINKTGTGTWVLSGNNTFGGGTTVTAGTLIVGSANGLSTSTNLTGSVPQVTFAGGTLQQNTGTLIDTTGTGRATRITASSTISGTAGNDFSFGGLTNTQAGNPTLTVNTVNVKFASLNLSNSGNNRTVTFGGSGNVTITGAVVNGSTSTGSSLAYSGSGSLTLEGTNTYGGATTISGGGTLRVNGSTTSATGFTGTGSTLAGSGSVGALTLSPGNFLAPGNGITPIGNFTMSSLNWTGGSMAFDLSSNSNSSDHLTITSGFTAGGGSYVFNFTGGDFSTTYTLADFGSTTLTDGSQFSSTGMNGTFAIVGNTLQFTSVPEPSAYAAVPALLAALLIVRKTRRKIVA